MSRLLSGKDKIRFFIAVMVLFAGICCFLPISDTLTYYSHFQTDCVQTVRSDLYEPIKVTRTEDLNRVDRGLLEQGEPLSGVPNVVILMPVAVLYILLCLLLFQTFCSIVRSMGIPLFFCDRILRYQHKKDGKKSI